MSISVQKELKQMKMKNDIFKEKGITLIALVITIIVMLILAGISLNLTIGENGILGKSREAVNQNNIARIRETLEMTLSGIQIDSLYKISTGENADFTYGILNTELKKNGFKIISDKNDANSEISESKAEEKIIENNDYKVVYITNDNEIYYVELRSDDSTGVTINGINVVGERMADVVTKENYGEEVNYSINNTSNWKILYNDKDNVFLISSDYIRVDNINQEKTGISKYNDYVGFWQNESSLKSKGISDISNLVVNKMNFNFGKEYRNNDNYKAKVSSILLNENNWSEFCDNNYALFSVGSPTIELWISAWNELYPENYLYTKYYSDDDSYYVGRTSDAKTSRCTKNDIQNMTGYSNKLFYPTTSQINGTSAYWMANPSLSGNMIIVCDGSIYADRYTGTVSGFRPVVCLKSSTIGERSVNEAGDAIWNLK